MATGMTEGSCTGLCVLETLTVKGAPSQHVFKTGGRFCTVAKLRVQCRVKRRYYFDY